MREVFLTCVECPMGCQIKVTMDGEKVVSVEGNSCPRGKLYAENEVVCPKRVVTSTVKTTFGTMLPVKTDRPVKKTAIFDVMKKINAVTVDRHVRIGDIVVENIDEDANLVATAEL